MKKMFIGLLIASIVTCAGTVSAMRQNAAPKAQVKIFNTTEFMIHTYRALGDNKFELNFIKPGGSILEPESEEDNFVIHFYTQAGSFAITKYHTNPLTLESQEKGTKLLGQSLNSKVLITIDRNGRPVIMQ